ncbi:MAG: hypothetical protein ACI4AE_00610 [Candidatus Cryptobacteroides sp.]
MEEKQIREELVAARAAVASGGKNLSAREDIVCGDVLLAENNLRENRNLWEIASLARELLDHATVLEGYDHLLDRTYEVLSRMSECIQDHPRLKLRLLRLWLTVVDRISAQTGHEMSAYDDILHQINVLKRNIDYADAGRFDMIEDERSLKHDPVEWTSGWEEVIDKADRIAEEKLADMPRGMGFCHAFWHERTLALASLGVEWKSPSRMNPKVLFD